MSDEEEEMNLEQAVRLLHRGRYRKSTVWTDIFSEFKSFAEVGGQQVAYFRMHETPPEYRYSEDSHSRVAAALSGLLANL